MAKYFHLKIVSHFRNQDFKIFLDSLLDFLDYQFSEGVINYPMDSYLN